MTMTEQTISRSDVSTASVGEAPAVRADFDYGIEVSDEARERAAELSQAYADRVLTTSRALAHRLEETQTRQEPQGLQVPGMAPQAGGPITYTGYQYWNCLLAGPYQIVGDPPFRPGNIITAGEPALFIALIWVNPLLSPGGGLAGTTVLGGREYRACFETVDITDVQNGPDWSLTQTFGSPANVVTTIPWFFRAPDPGPSKPKIYETHFAVDVTLPGQPFAAMATWHYDPNSDPGFMMVPSVGPQWQHDVPARYLVHRA